MKVYAAVLTYRPAATGRLELLAATVDSLAAEADEVYVVDNGSGVDEVAAITLRVGKPVTHSKPLHTCGHGTNLQSRVLAGTARAADICVHSDDDMFWRPGWRQQLERWWRSAPEMVRLTGCHVEPLYRWNEVGARVEFGGVPALVRQSTGAASWSYRARDRGAIFPIPERSQGTGDVPACRKVTASGGLVCQIDLAEHVGQTSTWGNRTVDLYGWDTAPALAMLAGAS